MTILLVDDEVAQRTVLSGYLKKKRHTILESENVAHAMTLLQHHPVDAIVSDFQMPNGTGLAITQQIVTQHHGNIRVESVHSKGTTFTISLPLPSNDV